MTTYADDAVAILDHLGIDRAVVAGLSMGGYIAFELVRRCRDRVRGLALIDTRAEADSPEGRRRREAAAQQAREFGAAAIADAMLPEMLAADTRTRDPALADRVWRMMAATPVAGILGALSAMRERPDSTPLLSSLADLPTLVVVGAEDRITPPDGARAMAARIPGVRLAVIPGAGHLPPVEAPDQTTAELRRFLATIE
jgi:pimeloyl-ACP methyl ester carboxylesterase